MREAAKEIVAVTVPLLGELVAVVLFIGMIALWSGVATGRI